MLLAVLVWSPLRMCRCEKTLSVFESFSRAPSPHHLNQWHCPEIDTQMLHLWCSWSSASSLESCDSEIQHAEPTASHFTFQGLLWLPQPQTEGHLTPLSGCLSKICFNYVYTNTTTEHLTTISTRLRRKQLNNVIFFSNDATVEVLGPWLSHGSKKHFTQHILVQPKTFRTKYNHMFL